MSSAVAGTASFPRCTLKDYNGNGSNDDAITYVATGEVETGVNGMPTASLYIANGLSSYLNT